jgi:excisionase family DNA binding protein
MKSTTESLTVAEAARELGVGRQQIRLLIYDGKLKAAKSGSTWAIDRASVEARKAAK